MSGSSGEANGTGPADAGIGSAPSRGRRALDAKAAARRRSEVVGRLRELSRRSRQAPSGVGASASEEHCDLCGIPIPADHRHMVHLDERRILCACETCWSVRSDDPSLRPTGARTVWLEDFELPEELWARFEVPIGLAFFLLDGRTGKVSALYPSPAGATESELELAAWRDLVELNGELRRLEPDAEALIVDRMSESHHAVIAPIDECYRLVGLIKARWEGISGGDGPERALEEFFTDLARRRASA